MAVTEDDITDVLKAIRTSAADAEGLAALAGVTSQDLRAAGELWHLSDAEIREALVILINRGLVFGSELFGRNSVPPGNA
jgi:hypothetical protein